MLNQISLALVISVVAAMVAPGLAAPTRTSAMAPPGPPRISRRERAEWAPSSAAPVFDANRPEAAPGELAHTARFVFQSRRDGNNEIYSAWGDGSHETRLTNHPGSDILPRLNRGSTRIAWVSNRDGNYEIYSMAVDGSSLLRLTNDAAEDSDPAWSPDGTRIAFSSMRSGNAEIYVMHADGAGLTRLTTNGARDVEPAWSPDGTSIAFISDRGAPANTGGRLWVMDADGSNPRQLSTVSDAGAPVWSPDGARIGFDGDIDGDGWTDALWIPAAGGSAAVFEYGNAYWMTEQWFGAWSPDGRYVFFTVAYFSWSGGVVTLTGHALEYKPTANWGSGTGTVRFADTTTDRDPDCQAADLTPPVTAVQSLPALSPAAIALTWAGSALDGPATSFGFDVEARQGALGSWTRILTGVSNEGQHATLYFGLGGETYYFRSRGIDEAGNVEAWPADADAWTTVEALPPASRMTALDAPPSAITVTLQWSATDPGGSGIAGYDVEYRIDPAPTWTRLFTRTTLTSTVFSVDTALAYHFRVRAIDVAGNIEAWPVEGGDSFRYPVMWQGGGQLYDNAGVPVNGGVLEFQSGNAMTITASADDGQFSADVWPQARMISVTVSKPGYGSISNTLYARFENEPKAYYLPPLDNVVADSGFEALLESGPWVTAGSAGAGIDARSRHTGLRGLTLGGLLSQGPTNVSRSPTLSSRPALAAGLNGQIHTAWIERNGELAEARYAWRASNGQWSEPHALYGSPMPANLALPADYGPDMAVDDAGSVHILWRVWPQGNAYYGIRAPGAEWSVYLVATGLDDDSLPRLAVDRVGNAHMVWHDGNGSRRDIFALRRSPDGVWSAIENLTGNDPYLVDARNPAIGVDITGTTYLAWENGTGFFSQRPAGGGWSAPTPVLAWPFNLSHPQLAVDQGGIAHVAWQAAKTGKPNGIVYASFGSGLVSHPTLVYTDLASIALKRLVLDSDGTPHLAWTAGDAAVFHGARNANGGWTVTQLSTRAAWTSAAVELASSDAGMWMAWGAQDRAGDFEGGCAKWTAAVGWRDFGACGLPWQGNPALGVASDGRMHLVFTPSDDDTMDIWHLSWPDAPVGPSRISQRLTLPVTLTSPGLSFLYRIDGSATDAQAAFTVTAETELGATAVYTSVETPGTPWRHVWRDMSAFAGQPITLTFAIDPRDGSGGARLALDEVSLGSTAPDLWVDSALPAEIRPATIQTLTLRYGNRGGGNAPGAAITLTLPPGLTFDSAEPAPISSAPALVWQLPAIPPGVMGPSIALTLSIGAGAAGSVITPTIAIASAIPELELANNAWRTATFVGYRAYLPVIRAP